MLEKKTCSPSEWHTDYGDQSQLPRTPSAPCSHITHHSELGLGLLDQIVLFGLADAGEDARLRVEVQHVALEICEEVAKTANATDSHHTLRGEEGRNFYPDEYLWCRNRICASRGVDPTESYRPLCRDGSALSLAVLSTERYDLLSRQQTQLSGRGEAH